MKTQPTTRKAAEAATSLSSARFSVSLSALILDVFRDHKQYQSNTMSDSVPKEWAFDNDEDEEEEVEVDDFEEEEEEEDDFEDKEEEKEETKKQDSSNEIPSETKVSTSSPDVSNEVESKEEPPSSKVDEEESKQKEEVSSPERGHDGNEIERYRENDNNVYRGRVRG